MKASADLSGPETAGVLARFNPDLPPLNFDGGEVEEGGSAPNVVQF